MGLYDGLYRLTNARYDFRTLTHGFTYDDLGNQLTFTDNGSDTVYTYNSVNEISQVAGTSVYYDKNGNLTKDTAASPGPYTYYYDRQNQLTKVTKVVDESETDVAEYAYDALARRIEFIDAVNTVTKRYYHDSQTAAADRVIEEYDAGGNRQRYYVWGNYVDELILLNDDAGDDSDYFVCYNHLFSPEALVDSDGNIVERYDYDAYGKPVIYTGDGGDDDWWDGDEVTATTSAKGLVYLFTGREYDALDTNANLPLQYSRARYYSFPLRRWLQRDPIGYADGMNLYEYVQSNPPVRTDPLGERIFFTRELDPKHKLRGTITLYNLLRYKVAQDGSQNKINGTELKKIMAAHKKLIEDAINDKKYKFLRKWKGATRIWEVKIKVIITDKPAYPLGEHNKNYKKAALNDGDTAKEGAKYHVQKSLGAYEDVEVTCMVRGNYNLHLVPAYDPAPNDPNWKNHRFVDILLHELVGHHMDNADEVDKDATTLAKRLERPVERDSMMKYDVPQRNKVERKFYRRHWIAGVEDVDNITGGKVAADLTSELDINDRWFSINTKAEAKIMFQMVKGIISGE